MAETERQRLAKMAADAEAEMLASLPEDLRAEGCDLCSRAAAEIERLRARIVELEAAGALRHGAMSQPQQSEPTSFTWNVPPTTPRD